VAIAGADEGCGTLFSIWFSHRRGTAVRVVGDNYEYHRRDDEAGAGGVQLALTITVLQSLCCVLIRVASRMSPKKVDE